MRNILDLTEYELKKEENFSFDGLTMHMVFIEQEIETRN